MNISEVFIKHVRECSVEDAVLSYEERFEKHVKNFTNISRRIKFFEHELFAHFMNYEIEIKVVLNNLSSRVPSIISKFKLVLCFAIKPESIEYCLLIES